MLNIQKAEVTCLYLRCKNNNNSLKTVKILINVVIIFEKNTTQKNISMPEVTKCCLYKVVACVSCPYFPLSFFVNFYPNTPNSCFFSTVINSKQSC